MYRTTRTTLGRLADEKILFIGDGYRTRRDQLATSGFRILRVADIEQGAIRATGHDFVDASLRHAMGEKVAATGDVLLTTKGTVGRVAVVEHLADAVIYSPQLCYFRIGDAATLSHRFLAFWLQSAEFVAQSSHLQGNTDMAPYLSLRDLRSIRISLPPLGVQRAIAEVLGALDDKIAANTKLISISDELAKLTLREASLGSDSVPLSETADFVNGRAFTKGASGTGRVVIRIAELNSGIGGSTVFSDAEVPDQHVAEPGDILFAWSGSLTLHRWYRPAGIVNQHIFKVIPRAGYPTWLVFQLIAGKLGDFKSTAADKATTMGHIQRYHLDELVRVPDEGTTARLDARMTGLWNSALTAEKENLSLAALRDTLLPQLMSGKLRVRDAERTVSEVL